MAEEWESVPAEERSEFWKNHTVTRGQYHHGFALKGWRETMEDTMDIKSSITRLVPNLFAVYDGHGGSDCAKYCKDKLLENLSKRKDLISGTKMALADSFISLDTEYRELYPEMEDGATATVVFVLPVDPNLEKLTKVANQNIKHKGSKIRRIESKQSVSYDKKSSMFNKEERKYRIFCAAVGDSRAILIEKSGKVIPLSIDHNLERKEEYDRIIGGNGDIREDPVHKEKLVYNEDEDRGLNVTRTIGDKFFKPLVTAFPEVKDFNLNKDSAFLVVASDGLWNKVSNEEVSRIILQYGITKGLKNLANLSNKREVFDNCTLIGVDLQLLMKTTDRTLDS